MELRLKYNDQVNRRANAAFVRGASVREWMREIDSWEINTGGMTCFIMPENIRSVSPAGLFVIFTATLVPDQNKLKNPYSLLGGKLFIPTHAELLPEISGGELKTLLVWDCYVFHPSIGLVGFEMNNKTDLVDLLEFDSPRQTNWGKAYAGNSALPELRHISVKQKSIEEILNSFKESVGTKPLDDIPEKGEKKITPAKKILNTFGRGLLKIGLFLTDVFGSAGVARSPGTPGGRQSGSSGLFRKFQEWLNKTLEELEKERDTELRRLLNMFDHDTDEALAYAIPLNRSYMQRGDARPSSRLSRNDANFNLSRLGGGRRVDSWNTQRYYADLRSKYQQSAKRELDAGNYKKAAYVYAHLLGDYSSAANVLVRGKYYREAATLYKDHLKNIPAAAECLENGGLLLEAIDLYKSLRKDEKIGDLFKMLGQDERAEKHYTHYVDLCLANDNYLEAARVIDQKLGKNEKAKEILLEGWEKSGQSENCLSGYFELTTSGEAKSIIREINSVYTNHTPRAKRTSFLNVLIPVFNRNNDEEVRELTRSIAYEIASEQALSGNPAGIQMLRNFLPGDRLISSDSSRFIYRNKSLTKFNTPIFSHGLDKGTTWITALTWRNQFIAIGSRKENRNASRLGLARGNWEEFWNGGKEVFPEYQSWVDKLAASFSLSVVADAFFTNIALIYPGENLVLSGKTLSISSQFEELIYLGTPGWLPKGLRGMAICGTDKLAVLYNENNLAQLAFYNMRTGVLTNSFGCLGEDKKPFYLAQQGEGISELIYRDEYVYFTTGAFLLRISLTGETESCNLNAQIFSFTASDHGAELRIIVSTDQGCVLVRPDFTKMNVMGGFIGADAGMDKVKYVPDNKVISAGGKRAIVYDVLQNDLQKRCSIETETPIVSILPVSRKNFCALLEENGKLSIHDIENV